MVARMFQVRMGNRHIVMPGQRRQMIVVTMLTAARIVPTPETTRPMIHRSGPTPGEFAELDSGVYPVQPNAAAPPGVANPHSAIEAPNRYNQYDNAFNRGNATSGAPICNGTM